MRFPQVLILIKEVDVRQARIYGRWLGILACFALCGAAGPSHPQDDAAAEIVQQTPARIEEFHDLARGIARQRPARLEEFKALAEDLARREEARVQGQADGLAAGTPPPAGERMLLFITLGEKPAEDLEANRRLFQDIRETSPETVIVLRGLPRGGRTLGDLFKYLRPLLTKDGPLVMLDPRLFRRYGVTVSPTLVYERDGVALAWARGIINAQWLKTRVERDKARGDQGKWGETAAIAERDFIDEMQSRLAGIDWQAKKDKAVAAFWQKQKFLDLPRTRTEKVFYLDATYKVEQDFILPDGKVIARAGDKIDLFKIMPPTFMLVVFDAADPQQVDWALKTGREYAGKHRVKYIATRIPDCQEHGWESWARLHQTLAAPVYLLNQTVKDRFKLAHAPSTVRFVKARRRFEVKEVCVEN